MRVYTVWCGGGGECDINIKQTKPLTDTQMSAHPHNSGLIMSSECKEIYENILNAVESGDISKLEDWIVPYGDFIAYKPVKWREIIDYSDFSRPQVPAHVIYGKSALEAAITNEDIDMLDMMVELARISYSELISIFEFTTRNDKLVSLAFLLKSFGFPKHSAKANGDVINFGQYHTSDRVRAILMNEYNHRGWYHHRWASLTRGILPVRRGKNYAISTDITNQFVDRILGAM